MNDNILNDFTLTVSENRILLQSEHKSSIVRFYARDIQYLGHLVSRSLIPFSITGSINWNNLFPALKCFVNCSLDNDNILKVVCGAYGEIPQPDRIDVDLSTFSGLANKNGSITASVYKKQILDNYLLQPLIKEIERNLIYYTKLCQMGVILPENFKKTAAVTSLYILCLSKTLANHEQITLFDDDLDDEIRHKDSLSKAEETENYLILFMPKAAVTKIHYN